MMHKHKTYLQFLAKWISYYVIAVR